MPATVYVGGDSATVTILMHYLKTLGVAPVVDDGRYHATGWLLYTGQPSDQAYCNWPDRKILYSLDQPIAPVVRWLQSA